MSTIEFWVPGTPQGKGRARATRQGRVYTPHKTVVYEKLAADCARQAMGSRRPLEGPLRVEIQVVHATPASWSKKRTEAVLAAHAWHTGKPDLDNVVKAIADAGNGILWKDDSQIVWLVATKLYDLVPAVRVRIQAAP